MKRVEKKDEFGTVESIYVGEATAWKHTQLKKLSDGPVLEHL